MTNRTTAANANPAIAITTPPFLNTLRISSIEIRDESPTISIAWLITFSASPIVESKNPPSRHTITTRKATSPEKIQARDVSAIIAILCTLIDLTDETEMLSSEKYIIQPLTAGIAVQTAPAIEIKADITPPLAILIAKNSAVRLINTV